MHFIFLLVVIWFVLDYCEKHTIAQMFGDIIMFIFKAVFGFIMLVFIIAAFSHQ